MAMSDNRLQCMARMVCAGNTGSQIASALGISEATVAKYLGALTHHRRRAEPDEFALLSQSGAEGLLAVEAVEAGDGEDNTLAPATPWEPTARELLFIKYVEAFGDRFLQAQVQHTWNLMDMLEPAYQAVHAALTSQDKKLAADSAWKLFEQVIPQSRGLSLAPGTQVQVDVKLQQGFMVAMEGLGDMAKQLASLGTDTFANHLRDVTPRQVEHAEVGERPNGGASKSQSPTPLSNHGDPS